MQFEDIRKNFKKFNALINTYGTQNYIEKCIVWDKIAYARDLLENKEILPVICKTETAGKKAFYLVKKDKQAKISKRDLAYSYDLFDKDGKLLNIAMLGL